ncbi:hypothetical protein Bca52824_053006 [Brassica carinata]|uniref:Uncharacterized protein n=1 Tax=Brassica carinata TaxID=52824 RepID=A0A8X7R4W0_BRACI|nr:hypothetical protein Bca52824_053006 [Brassica carinata]
MRRHATVERDERGAEFIEVQGPSSLLCADIEILLQEDLVTLDEALRNANNAVSMSVNAVSALISISILLYLMGMHENFIEVTHKDLKELEASEVTTDLNAIICIVASSVALHKKDVKTILPTFRQVMEYTGDIIVSTVHEPDLELKVLVTIFFLLSCSAEETSSKDNMFSGLIPFVLNIFEKYRSQLQKETSSGLGDVLVAIEDAADSTDVRSSSQSVEGLETDSEELPGVSVSENGDNYGSIQREPIANWSMDPGHKIEQNRVADSGDTTVLSLAIVNLPVGVRPSKNLNGSLSVTSQPSRNEMNHFSTLNSSSKDSSSDTASTTLLSDRYADFIKQRNLSALAASMLVTERDSSKRWSPIIGMQYRGELFKGRCQGGLPEGKGRLVFGDGSIYDGMWHKGKRCGLGTFYFKNGDVFQGTWREDLIHGKTKGLCSEFCDLGSLPLIIGAPFGGVE